jgi:hypothetical protein
MVESIKTLCDLIADFLKQEKQERREAFENYFTPLYEGCKKVFDDYLALFAEMKRKAQQKAELEALADFIDERRHATLSVRHEMRATIEEFASQNLAGRANLPPFEGSIIGILTGTFETAHALGHFSHSLNNYIANERHGGKKPSGEYLNKFIADVDEQARFMEAQFKTVTREYAAIKAKQTPKRSLKRKKTKT